tara:strand:- start:17962 stop:19449 length:1488 start_codon:yes stop_codon:yes gene_type:complete
MAKTYIGYERRSDLTSVVDWTSIGEKLSQDISNVGNIAAAAKKKVDDKDIESRKTFDEITSPLTNNPNVMASALTGKQFAGDAYRKMQNGEMSMNDYLMIMQKFNSGAKNYVNFYTTQGEIDKEHQERVEKSSVDADGDFTGASAIETSSYSYTREFLNSENTRTFPNEQGNWVTAIYDDQGKEISRMSVLQMQLAQNVKSDPFKYNKFNEESVMIFGKEQVMGPNGLIKTSDPRQKSKFNEALEKRIDSVVDNPNTQMLASIMTDYLGYNPVYNEKDKKTDKDIYLEYKNINGRQVPMIPEDDLFAYKNIARNEMRQAITIGLDKTISGSKKQSLDSNQKKIIFLGNLQRAWQNKIASIDITSNETFGGEKPLALEAPKTTAKFLTEIFGKEEFFKEWVFDGGEIDGTPGPLTVTTPPDKNNQTTTYVLEPGDAKTNMEKMLEYLSNHLPVKALNLIGDDQYTGEMFTDENYIALEKVKKTGKKQLPGKQLPGK